MIKVAGVAPRTKEQLESIAHDRHKKAMSDPNPACRRHPRQAPERDRPEDVEFNEACRRFERDMWP